MTINKPDKEKIYQKTANLCSKTEKCRSDIYNKLIKQNISSDDINYIVEKLVKQDFINEKRYAEAFVNDKFKFNKWGKIKIKAHLKNKKINDLNINKATENINNEEYYETARKLIAEKSKNLNEPDEYKKKIKILNFMASRGFEQEIIRSLIYLTE